jgi:putative oxidoreductase
MGLLARVLLSAIFLWSGGMKLMMPVTAMAAISQLHLPMPAQLAWLISVVIEVGGGLCVLLGYRTRPAALALALFCVVTGIAVHYHPGNRDQMIQLMKNLAIAGGMLQLAATGPGGYVFGGARQKAVKRG